MLRREVVARARIGPYPLSGVCVWQEQDWGGGLMLSKAQKSAATPIQLLLASAGGT